MRYCIFSNNSFSPLMISSVGFASDTEVTRFGPGKRNFYIIHYVTKGEGYYNGNPVKQGQGFLIYPGQFEEYHADTNNPWEFLWVISSDDAMKKIFDKYKASSNTLIFDYYSVPKVQKIADEIVYKNNYVLDSLKILELFLHIFNSHTAKDSMADQKTNSELYLDFCLRYIEENIYRKITVAELTSRLGISQSYLYKLFSNKFSMSAKQYITRYKINCAKTMLVETDMTITQIANSVGYSDSLSFSKAFSLKEKISPQKYRSVIKDMV